MCSGAKTRSDTAFMGFYAVEPEYRKLGIGRALWSATTSRLDESINVGLWAVPSMACKYKSQGFVIEDSVRMLVYESKPSVPVHLNLIRSRVHGYQLVTFDNTSSDILLKKLIDYDTSIQKFSREELLRHYFTGSDVPLTLLMVRDTGANKTKQSTRSTSGSCQYSSSNVAYPGERKSSCCARPSEASIIEDETLCTSLKSTVSLSSSNLGESHENSSPTSSCDLVNESRELLESGYEIFGYGCIRRDNNSGGIIGPIYAESGDLFEVILRNLMERFSLEENRIFSVMALDCNKLACKVLSNVGLVEIEQCAKMFTKFIPSATYSKIFCLHSPNFTLF